MNERYGEQRDDGESRRFADERGYGSADRERDRYGRDDDRSWGFWGRNAHERDARDERYRNPSEHRSRGYGESSRPAYWGHEDRGYGGSDAYRSGYGGGSTGRRSGYGSRSEDLRGGYAGGWNTYRSGGLEERPRWEADRGPAGGWGLGHDPYQGSDSAYMPDWGQQYGQPQYGRDEQLGRSGWDSYGDRSGGRGATTRLIGRGPKGYKRSDERIREEICERLWRTNFVDSSEVTVTVKEGEVNLSGTVPERWMRYQIENIADECLGVKDVNNTIRIQRSAEGWNSEQTSTARTASAPASPGQGTKQ